MCDNVLGKFVLVVCILTAIAASAQNQGYLLRSEGPVSVNGIAVSSSALVSDGDVIQTGKGGSAKIAAPGMAMRLGENSRLAVSNGRLAIDSGSAAVTSTARVATFSSQYAIKPIDGDSARYLVSNHGGSLFVTSESGGLSVTAPNMASRSLLSGQRARFTPQNYEVFSSSENEGGQSNSFSQLIGSYSSNLCRTAAACYCKTAARCPNK